MAEECWLYNNCRTHAHCNEDCLIKFKLSCLFEKSLLPKNKWGNQELFTDADGTDRDKFVILKEIQDNIVSFVDSGKNLYLYSIQAGNGKTSWSIRLAQTYMKKIWKNCELECKVLFINVPSFLLALKANITAPNEYYQYIKDNVNRADLVIWDDIGNKVGTEFEISHLLSIIDTRMLSGKSNIYTSNINPEELGKLLDIRLASRIASSSKCIQLNGGDKRGW